MAKVRKFKRKTWRQEHAESVARSLAARERYQAELREKLFQEKIAKQVIEWDALKPKPKP